MKESDIRPKELYQTYLQLSHEDSENCFGNDERTEIPCVACGSVDVSSSFEKMGFKYVECSKCGTLYLSPRPSIKAFEDFYRDSKSSNYWAEVFFPATAEIRRETIFKPRVARLSKMATKSEVKVDRLIDVGAGYGIFVEEWQKNHPAAKIVAVEPSHSLATECRKKGFETSEEMVEDVEGYDGYADLVVCFEVLEHAYDPLFFIESMKKLARPGGLVFISTLCIDGFDFQILWEKSSQISPPHHINFLSVAGFKYLYERAGLVDIDVSTPGKLDVDIIRNATQGDPSLLADQRFLTHVVNDDVLANSFQEFLSKNSLSSHAWVMGKVPL